MDQPARSEDVRDANERCARGEHPPRPTDPRVVAFYAALTNAYPDSEPHSSAVGSPWAKAPLHAAADHVWLQLDESCPDHVLEAIERLAAEHKLDLLDLQDGTVYPPPVHTQ